MRKRQCQIVIYRVVVTRLIRDLIGSINNKIPSVITSLRNCNNLRNKPKGCSCCFFIGFSIQPHTQIHSNKLIQIIHNRSTWNSVLGNYNLNSSRRSTCC